MPFITLQRIAEELHCSVMDAADADPEWRQMARTLLFARIEAGRDGVS